MFLQRDKHTLPRPSVVVSMASFSAIIKFVLCTEETLFGLGSRQLKHEQCKRTQKRIDVNQTGIRGCLYAIFETL